MCLSCLGYPMFFDNNFIMKVTRDRNPYLRRIYSHEPHKYSYDLESGKHMLISKEGKELVINKTGTIPAKFKQNFTGFIDHHQRYKEAANDPSVLHYAPDMSFVKEGSYHTPMPDKFAGYTQFPYKLRKEFPTYLRKPNEPARYPIKKSFSLQCQKTLKQPLPDHSLILGHTYAKFQKQSPQYFDMSFVNMTETKPLPKHRKKTCYNYKCKFMKQFTFDEKQKTASILNTKGKTSNVTLGKSFYQQRMHMQAQQTKLLSTMALTSATSTS